MAKPKLLPANQSPQEANHRHELLQQRQKIQPKQPTQTQTLKPLTLPTPLPPASLATPGTPEMPAPDSRPELATRGKTTAALPGARLATAPS